MKLFIINFFLLLTISVAAQQKELLLDDFNDNKNNWEEGDEEDFDKFVKKGFYHVINTSDKKVTWNSIAVPINQKENFSIETSVSLTENKEGEAIFIFGENNKTNDFYFIQIRDVPNKYSIYIGKREKGEWSGIYKNAKINPIGKYNRLTVKKIKDKLQFLVNGIIVHTKNYESFFGNGLGLGCGGPQHAVFDYVLVIENQKQ